VRGDGSVRGWQSVDVAGRKRPLRKAGTACIRSAWGVVKRAMHLEGTSQEERTAGSPNEAWVPVVEVSLAEAGRTHLWSKTCCVRREAWPQARRERRSGLDLATEWFAHPAMGGGTRPR